MASPSHSYKLLYFIQSNSQINPLDILNHQVNNDEEMVNDSINTLNNLITFRVRENNGIINPISFSNEISTLSNINQLPILGTLQDFVRQRLTENSISSEWLQILPPINSQSIISNFIPFREIASSVFNTNLIGGLGYLSMIAITNFGSHFEIIESLSLYQIIRSIEVMSQENQSAIEWIDRALTNLEQNENQELHGNLRIIENFLTQKKLIYFLIKFVLQIVVNGG